MIIIFNIYNVSLSYSLSVKSLLFMRMTSAATRVFLLDANLEGASGNRFIVVLQLELVDAGGVRLVSQGASAVAVVA